MDFTHLWNKSGPLGKACRDRDLLLLISLLYPVLHFGMQHFPILSINLDQFFLSHCFVFVDFSRATMV